MWRHLKNLKVREELISIKKVAIAKTTPVESVARVKLCISFLNVDHVISVCTEAWKIVDVVSSLFCRFLLFYGFLTQKCRSILSLKVYSHICNRVASNAADYDKTTMAGV